MKRHGLTIALLALVALAAALVIHPRPAVAAPAAGHPRLWLTQADIPRLRAWATPANPMWQEGLVPARSAAIAVYDNRFFPGGWPNPNWTTDVDNGGTTMTAHPAEAYAEFFAFLSLVDPDPTARIAHARRARNLLMVVINEAAKGHAPHMPYRDPIFASYDRSRWWGEGFGLTVDWLHDALDEQGTKILTDADRAVIRDVFVVWCEDNLDGYRAPPRALPRNSPLLIETGARNAANNYFSGHMRNLTLMALALDPAEDPGGALRGYLDEVLGKWLYLQYALYEEPEIVAQAYGLGPSWLPKLGNASGGLPAEGLLYGESIAYVRQALFALSTAGYDDPAIAGPQIALLDSAYWDRHLDAFLHSLPPTTTTVYPWMGPIYQPGGYGDMLRLYVETSMSDLFATLAASDIARPDAAALARIPKTRWILAHAIEGGVGRLFQRVANPWPNGWATQAILHFMAFDPESARAAAQIPEPRSALPTTFHDPALGRVLARTDWSSDATYFGFKCSWIAIDHQNADCNQFELYRRGEWLTKEHSNYDNVLRGQTTDYHNTLSLQNDTPADMIPGLEEPIVARGSQYMLGRAAGDPTMITSAGTGYTFAQGDGTNLYNHRYPWGKGALDVEAAIRSTLWLHPDVVVVYDRATTKTAGRFKRHNLQLVGWPSVSGDVAVSTSPSGQRLFIQSLLPVGATLTPMLDEPIWCVADTEPTQFRLIVEDPSHPADVRFLQVLQGADPDQAMLAAAHVASADGRYEGAIVGGTAVLFQATIAAPAPSLSYVVPPGVSAHVVTGLAPAARHLVQAAPGPGGVGTAITISADEGGAFQSDEAGVLVLNPEGIVSGLTPASVRLPASGGTGSFTASVLDNASFAVTSLAPFITLTAVDGGTVRYAVAPNPGAIPRTGKISAGDQVFTIDQAGIVTVSPPAPELPPAATTSACSYALSLERKLLIAGATSKGVLVKANAGCAWAAQSSASWLTAVPASGTGTGTVTFTATPNPATTTRSATLSIGGRVVTVTQAGNAGDGCIYAFGTDQQVYAPATAAAPHHGGAGSVSITAPGGCSWLAASSVPWITTGLAGASGNAAIPYTVAANPGAPRSGTLTIAGMTFTITQD